MHISFFVRTHSFSLEPTQSFMHLAPERLAGSKCRYLLYCFENTHTAQLAQDATPVPSGGFWLRFTDLS